MITPNYYLLKYVKGKFGKRIGVVVAVDSNKVGWSKLNRRDRWDKVKGINIALGRAFNGSKVRVPDSIKKDVSLIEERAKKYFK